MTVCERKTNHKPKKSTTIPYNNSRKKNPHSSDALIERARGKGHEKCQHTNEHNWPDDLPLGLSNSENAIVLIQPSTFAFLK